MRSLPAQSCVNADGSAAMTVEGADVDEAHVTTGGDGLIARLMHGEVLRDGGCKSGNEGKG